MKLICFSNNTGGGLVCDLLNNTQTKQNAYYIPNTEHAIFKLLDTATISTNVNNIAQWMNLSKQYKSSDLWYGTHTHPSGIPNLEDFEDVLIITTMSRESKLYRFLRYYYGWFFLVNPVWKEDNSLEKIDKIRELAKNVFVEFYPWKDYRCVEFSDIVSGKFVTDNNLNYDTYCSWRDNNLFLFDSSLNSWGIDRFNEAEYEMTTGNSFKYF